MNFKRIITIVMIALSSTAGAQSIFDFSVWATAQGLYAPLRGTASVGVGYRLPLGIGTVGLEVTPIGKLGSGENVFGVAAVVRDIPIPFTPISLRGDVGLEQYTLAGPFDGSNIYVFAGANARYQIFGPLGVTGGARVYLNNPNVFTVMIGLDLVL